MTSFAILNGDARRDGARAQLQQLTHRVASMKDAAYDELLEWISNSTIAVSNSTIGDNIKLEDPGSWLEVQM